MNVVHVSPTYFSGTSVIGGGERYVSELSKWTSKRVKTTLVSFSAERTSHRDGSLRVEVYPAMTFLRGNKINPLNFRYLEAILAADVVHVHHIHTLVSDMACLFAASLRKPVFVTDYGGGADFVLNHRLPVFPLYRNAIAYSQFGLDRLPEPLKQKALLIKGGIDTDRFLPDPAVTPDNTVLFVGRLLPHKGVDYLIDGFRHLNRTHYKLKIVGRVHEAAFYEHLRARAAGLPVEFYHDVTDEQLIGEYRRARVTVLPSVHRTYAGQYSAVPELMGFTLLESQACGTPVICTDAGAMPEFVDPGRSGLVVAQNSPQEIAAAIRHFADCTAAEYASHQQSCHQWVNSMNWEKVVATHLRIYENSLC